MSTREHWANTSWPKPGGGLRLEVFSCLTAGLPPGGTASADTCSWAVREVTFLSHQLNAERSCD